MVGMALGEARGTPFSGLSAERIRDQGGIPPQIADPKELQIKEHAVRIQRGVYEDDTQAALCVSDTLLREGRVNPESLRTRFMELAQPVPGHFFGSWRRPHRNLRVAIRRMLEGKALSDCATPSAGMGAAARGVPIGIMVATEEDVVRSCIAATTLTHSDPRAIAATIAVAGLVRSAMAAALEDFDPDQTLEDVLELVRLGEARIAEQRGGVMVPEAGRLSTAIDAIADQFDKPLGKVFADIVERSNAFAARKITSVSGGFATAAIPALMHMLLTDFDDFADGLDGVLAEGGGTDNFGAIAGAFLGALHGESAIPRQWLMHLPSVPELGLRGAALAGARGAMLTPILILEAQITRPVKSELKKSASKRFRGKLGHRQRLQAKQARIRRLGKSSAPGGGGWAEDGPRGPAPRRFHSDGPNRGGPRER
jgi:ADP-ribosylglycohydrolase